MFARTPRIWVLSALMPAMLSAQAIHRCGNTYSHVPCAGGVAIAIDDSRTAAQKAQTDAATVQAMRQAGQMERARLTRNPTAVRRPDPARNAGSWPQPKAQGHSKDKGTEKNRVTAKGPATTTPRKGREPEFFTAASQQDVPAKNAAPSVP